MTGKEPIPMQVTYPDAEDLHLRFAVGACRLKIRPGEDEPWVAGTYTDPSGALPVRIRETNGTVRIGQRRKWAEMFGWLGGVPTFDLALGTGRPYRLTVETGASECTLDLGGLPLTRLTIRHGAGRMEVDFSAANPTEMSRLTMSGGAGGMELHHLAHANVADVRIDGGAAAYVFDFGGTLQRDGNVRISTGVSSVEIRVPASTAAKIVSESLMGGLDLGDGFTKQEGAFWTTAAVAEETPALTIRTSVALGALKLRVT
jgi:hypothetical protein